jgi:RimJ/RimL family protein N-acetyltransferase
VADAAPGVASAPRVERVTEATWRAARDVRLAALIDSPRSFWTRYPQEAALTDDQWRARATGPVPTWLAWDGDLPLGTVALVPGEARPDGQSVLVGMWVVPRARGNGVAGLLVEALLDHARGTGVRRVTLEVARENARAARFYLRRGFALTGETGAMPWDPTCVEVRMALDLD